MLTALERLNKMLASRKQHFLSLESIFSILLYGWLSCDLAQIDLLRVVFSEFPVTVHHVTLWQF